ncbi:MAG: hypothetical protein Q3M24_22365 [Candidatus Electrothrix aestuarii]|uniref:Uncharacterized protein n=1 Tax=Candidatus Electrothrix aestuarii TaxID=3062594 RepID=A0AAU8LVQ9_9BACT|nr:hypothetical protein [Candidatus Electrothrix aestuarii]
MQQPMQQHKPSYPYRFIYRFVGQFLFTALLLASSQIAQAMVSEYAEFYIPYQRLQSEEICLQKQIMEAEFGIPLASMMTGIFSPTKTLHQRLGGENEWRNINLLADSTAGIPWDLTFDRYNENGIYDYSFTLDMGPLTAELGDAAEARQKVVDRAKLAIIAIIKTAESMHRAGHFRVWVHFKNLPSQDGLTGSTVYSGKTDWPGWPYTSSSPLYQAYVKEMIGNGC